MNRRNALKTLAVATVATAVIVPTLPLVGTLEDLKRFVTHKCAEKNQKILVYSENPKDRKLVYNHIKSCLGKGSKIELGECGGPNNVDLKPGADYSNTWLGSFDFVLCVNRKNTQPIWVEMIDLKTTLASKVWVV